MDDIKDRQIMQTIMEAINAEFNKNNSVGFVVLAFNLSDPGSCNYISNCDREDTVTALRETADRLEKKGFTHEQS